MTENLRPTIKEKLLINLVEDIFKVRPVLKELFTEIPVINHLMPGLSWNPDPNNFPKRKCLEEIIIMETERLYGFKLAQDVSGQLTESWCVETGAHLHIPRRFDRVTIQDSHDFTPIVSQGQIFVPILRKDFDHRLNISLNTGRVPPDNDNSGAFLDLPSLEKPLRLVPSRFDETPQTLIPAISASDLQKKRQQLETFLGQKRITIDEFKLGCELLKNFENHPDSFSDQAATTHALVMDKTLTSLGVKQITLDSEKIGVFFLRHLLKDKSSIIHEIFSNQNMLLSFINLFADISTGWSSALLKTGLKNSVFKDSVLFTRVDRSSKEPKTTNLGLIKENGQLFIGDKREFKLLLEPKAIEEALSAGVIMPTGVLKFFSFLTEAGLCMIGGMNQAGYSTLIKEKACELLTQIGLVERAKALLVVPTQLIVISPSWGIVGNEEEARPLDLMSVAINPLTREELLQISKINGRTALTLSSLALGQLFNIGTKLSVEDLLTIIDRNEVVVRS